MRTDPAAFAGANTSRSASPRHVVELSFNASNTDVAYLTSHADALTPGGTVLPSCVASISGISQQLTPEKALSTIGSLKVSALDIGGALTALIRAKLGTGQGMRGMRLRVYTGFDTAQAWSDYVLVQTQIVDAVETKDGLYTVTCSDVQRTMRRDIFTLSETSLSADIPADATTLPVFSTAGFETKAQGASYTDAPGQTVGYVAIEGDGDRVEIIRYTGKTTTEFTGCTRGVLGTQPLTFNSTGTRDDAVKVREYVYLELPAVQLIYAILTGEVFGQAGGTLPAAWHLGISTDYVSTPHFQNIGADLWDVADPSKGLVVRFQGLGETDGKRFIEEELLQLAALYMPVLSDGQLYLKRMTGVLSSSGYVAELGPHNIVDHSALVHDMRSVKNKVAVRWNWSELFKDYTRRNLLIDQGSIDTHGEAPLYEMEFRGLHGSRHSADVIRGLFDAQRDRFAGPALRLQVTALPSANTVEVGDVVRVTLPQTEDYSGTGGLSRAFEVQRRSVDWVTGRVAFTLFGSSQAADALEPDELGTPLPDAWYTSTGTDIAALPGVTSAGGLITIGTDVTLTGGADVNTAVYYADGDLTVAAGVTATITDNVQIRARGFVTIDGTIDGKGRGLPGAVGAADTATVTTNTAGFLGLPALPAHPIALGVSSANNNHFDISYRAATVDFTNTLIRPDSVQLDARESVPTEALNTAAPLLSVAVESGALTGIPPDLRGSPGSAGYPLMTSRNVALGPVQAFTGVAGGAGGAGGAGLTIVSRGLGFGVNGGVNLSAGEVPLPPSGALPDAALTYGGVWVNALTATAYASFGAAGSPGAFYSIIDGAGLATPVLAGRVVAKSSELAALPGGAAVLTGAIDGVGSAIEGAEFVRLSRNDGKSIISTAGTAPAYDMSASAARVQILAGEVAAVPDLDYVPPAPAALGLSELVNFPRSTDGTLSTINAIVTPPADANFAYAVIEYRKKPATKADQDLATWAAAASGATEGSFYVKADGSTYQVRARTVGLNGTPSASYLAEEITVSDAANSPQTVLTAPVVTGLQLSGVAGTDYDGHDVAVVWNQDGQAQGGDGTPSYFSHYRVDVRTTGGALLRSETTLTAAYTYTLEKNRIDNGGVPLRSVRFDVVQVTRQAQESATAATFTANNPSPAVVSGVNITPGLTSISVGYTAPADNDFAGVDVHVSASPSFTPDASNLAFSGADNPAVIEGLTSATPYYVRIKSRDGFGTGGQTGEIPATTETNYYGSLVGLPDELADINAGEGAKLGGVEDNATQNTIYRQASTPAGSTGDIWYDTDDNLLYRHNGATWDVVGNGYDNTAQLTDGASLGSTAIWGSVTGTGKPADNATQNTIYRQASTPAGSTGDIWYDTDDNLLYRHNGTTWDVVGNGYDNTSQLTDGASLGSTAIWGSVTGTGKPADNATQNTIYRQASTPAGSTGDIWYDTDDDLLYRHNGATWDVVGNGYDNTAQLTDGASLGSTAVWGSVTGTGKPEDNATQNTIYRQVSAPAGSTGDIWYDTDDNLLYRHNGTTWDVVGNGYDNTSQLTDGASLGSTAVWGSVTGTGKPADNADVTEAAVNVGVNVTTNGGGLYSGKTSYASTAAGWWIGRDASAGKFHFGNASKWVKWDGVNLEIVGGLKTSSGTGQRVEIDETSNELNVYADRGDGVVAQVISAGVATVGADYWFLSIGGSGSEWGGRSGIWVESYNTYGVYANAVTGIAVRGASSAGGYGGYFSDAASGIGVYGSSASGPGVKGASSVGYGADFSSGTSSKAGCRALSNNLGFDGSGTAYDFYARGSGTNYGPFTGAHDAAIPAGEAPEVGDIICDGALINAPNVSNSIHAGHVSAEANTPAIGVFVKSYGPECFEGVAALAGVDLESLSGYRYAIVNAVGEGMVNVCDEGGNIAAGDLIVTSNTPGKGKRQADDFVKAYTVARARESVVWSNEETTVKLISCIYLCG